MSDIKNKDQDIELICDSHKGLADLYFKYNKSRVIGISQNEYYYFTSSKLWKLEISRAHMINDIRDFLIIKIKDKMIQYIENKKITDELRDILYKVKTGKTCDYIFEMTHTQFLDITFMDKLNKSKYELPIKNNKIINLKTKQIRDRIHTDYFDFEINCEYTEHQENALKFFKSIMCDNMEAVEYIKRILGYSISGDTSKHSLFISWGEGGNGKSALYSLINKIITNKLYTPCNKKIFIKNESNSSHTEHLIPLLCSRIGVYSESAKNAELNEDTIKQITGGDAMDIRAIYGRTFQFKPICKFHMMTNNKPIFTVSESMRRRIVYIPFNARFCDNPKLLNEYKKDVEFIEKLENEYINEVFSFLIDGAYSFFKSNTFGDIPDTIQKQTDNYYKELDSIQCFIDQCIIADPINNIKKTNLYDEYNSYCNGEGVKNIETKQSFYKALESKNYMFIIINGTRYVKNIKLIN